MHRRLLSALLTFVAVAVAAPAPASAVGLPQGWTKGFNYTAWWQDGYSTTAAQASLDALATTGANEIALFPTWYMASKTSSTVAFDSARTPTDASLAVAVARAKAKGLKVMLRPSVDPLDGSSRLYLAPASPSAWFASYRTMILHYADLATRLGVDSLSIGVELQSMTVPGYESTWRSIIADVRARFSGPLTYGAAMLEYERIPWWDALDVIGIDAYFQLSNGATPSEDQVVANWHSFTDQYGRTHRYVDEIAAVQARFGKPVMFTELGYRSALNALFDPWNAGGVYSAIDQQIAISAAFRVFRDKPWFRGVHLWHWFAQNPAHGGPGDTDLTPQNKPAQATITSWFTAPPPVAVEPAPAPQPAPAPAPEPQPAPAPEPQPAPAPQPQPAPVNEAPTIRLDAPVDGQTFTSSLSLEATAADDGAVSKVTFEVDGAVVATDTTAPYQHHVGKKLAYGSHRVTATATDAHGLTASASAQVTRVRSTKTTLRAAAAADDERGRTVTLSGRVTGARGGRVRVTLTPVRRAGARATTVRPRAAPSRSRARLVRG